MDTQVQSMERAQRDKWDILGAKPVWQRGTVRLPQFMKSFADDVVVTVRDQDTNEWKPFMLRTGRPLRAAEILPERADLALDESGHLLNQMEFERNYMIYLESFVLPAGSDTRYEPVKSVSVFVNATPDRWGESRGMVEIDFDPHIEKEFKPQKLIDADGNDVEMSSMKNSIQKLADLQLALAESLIGANDIKGKVSVETQSAPIGIPIDKIAAASEPADKERMPCGVYKNKGSLKRHQRFCKEPECVRKDEAA